MSLQARCVPALDTVERDGDSVVLLAGQVLHVSAVGTAVRSLSTDWTDLPVLTEALVSTFGAPPEAGDEATERVLRELADAGLVTLRESPGATVAEELEADGSA